MPILKYAGAKWRIADWIVAHMPPHISYLEPYFGSGAVFFNKAPSTIETINDIDDSVVNFFRVCRDFPDELAEAIELTPWSRTEYMNCEHRSTDDADVERARKFAVDCWMAFGGRIDQKTGWRHATGRGNSPGPNNAKLWNRIPQAVHQVAARLKDAHIECRPAIEVIRDYNGENILIYADPPYMRGTRSAHGNVYRHEMTDWDHEEMLAALKNHTGPVLISGYENELYRDMLTGWSHLTLGARTELGSARTETLWINRSAKIQTSIEDL